MNRDTICVPVSYTHLERKIVRLIIMSNISRRQFLKGAGVATLAVAAAGVLRCV